MREEDLLDKGTPFQAHRRLAMIHDLAGSLSQADVARKYNLSPNAVNHYAERHAEEIQAVREDPDNEFAALWIARKKNRLAQYQKIHDDFDARENLDADVKVARVKMDVLHRVAEEMGHLPTKSQVEVTTKQVHYTIEGVAPEDLP